MEQIKKIFAKEIIINIDEVKNNSHLVDDLGGDSLDHIEMIMCVEETFDINIPNEDEDKLFTPNQIFNYLKENGVKVKDD